MERAREEGGKILVHCRVGVSRSATVTVRYRSPLISSGSRSSHSFIFELVVRQNGLLDCVCDEAPGDLARGCVPHRAVQATERPYSAEHAAAVQSLRMGGRACEGAGEGRHVASPSRAFSKRQLALLSPRGTPAERKILALICNCARLK